MTAGAVWAQSPELPRVRTFTPTDYGGRNQNWMIAQGGDGQLHVANSAGIVSFDGDRWRRRSLRGQKVVRAIAATPDGRIYAGAYGEFGYFSPDTDQYTSLSQTLPASEVREEIWNIVALDSLVVFHSFGAIYVSDGQRVEKVLPPGVILNLTRQGDDLLVPVIDQGIYRWRPGRDFRLLPDTEALAGQRVKGIIEHRGSLLIATELNGFYRWQEGRLRSWSFPLAEPLALQQINRFQRLRDGSLAVGTILGGLYILDAQGQLRYHLARATGLQNNTVIALHQDRAGDLWVGMDRGLDLVVLSDPLRYFTGSQQAIGAVYAATVWQDRLYVGTNQGLFVRSLATNEAYRLVPGTQGQVWELRVLDDQLLCGHNSGTFRIEGDRAIRISDMTGGWQLLPLATTAAHILQATYTGVARYRRQPAGWWILDRRIDSLVAPLRQLVAVAPYTFLATHASQGLYRLTSDSMYSTFVQIEELGKEEGLPTDQAFYVTPFAEGLLVQTAEHNWLYREARFEQLTTFRGQPLHAGARVLSGTDDSWFQVLPDRLEVHRAGRATNLAVPISQDHPRIFYLNDQRYLFCLDEGYALLPANRLTESETLPAPLLQWQYYGATGWESLPGTVSTLKARQNHLRFTYAQSVFDRAHQYQYRLLGFQDSWSAWSARPEKEYTNLPPGNYRFELRSKLGQEVVPLSFTILPPWYLSGWSYALYTLLTLLAVLALYRWHRYRLLRQARVLERERERQLAQERTQLRNQQLRQDIIRKNEELANTTLNLARKKEILLDLKQEIEEARQRSLSDRDHRKLATLVNRHLSDEQDWAIFESNFTQVHEDFLKRLKREYPDLTPGDLKLAAYLRMNLSSKEVAPLLHISLRGVENKRYRLRKKMNLDPDTNLTEFFMNY